MKRWLLAAAAAVALLGAGGSGSRAPGNALLNVPGLNGGSQLTGFRGWIDVTTFVFGSATSGAGKNVIVPLQFTKIVDSTSPIFAEHLLSKKPFSGTTKLRYVTARGELLSADITDALVVRDEQSSSQSGPPTETIVLSFAALKYCADNACWSWDYAQNRPGAIR